MVRGKAGQGVLDHNTALRLNPQPLCREEDAARVRLTHHQWVDRHNHRRLHTPCADLTPADLEQVYYRQHPALAKALVPTS